MRTSIVSPGPAPTSREHLRVDVQLAVAEPVDPEHLGLDLAVLDVRAAAGCPGVSDAGSMSSPSTASGIPFAMCAIAGAMMSRPANVGPGAGSWYSSFSSTTTRSGPAEQRHRRCQQAVVGPDEHAVGDLDHDAAPVRPDAGIDDREHETLREVLDGPGEGERTRRGRRTAGRRG